MKILSILLIVIVTSLTLSCRQANNSKSRVIVTNKDSVDKIEQADDIGTIISKIDFKIKAKGEDLKTFNDGIIPWISIANPKTQLSELVDADEMVLPFTTANIIIDYPLKFPDTFEIKTAGQGFSRKQLILEISNRYHEIYKLEESSATTKTLPMDKREGLINRNETNGKFGVCCHDITDLDLGEIEVHRNLKGQITLTLEVES